MQNELLISKHKIELSETELARLVQDSQQVVLAKPQHCSEVNTIIMIMRMYIHCFLKKQFQYRIQSQSHLVKRLQSNVCSNFSTQHAKIYSVILTIHQAHNQRTHHGITGSSEISWRTHSHKLSNVVITIAHSVSGLYAQLKYHIFWPQSCPPFSLIVRVSVFLQTCRDFVLMNHLVPSTVLVTPYHSDIVIYDSLSSSMGIVELTCLLDSKKNTLSWHVVGNNKRQNICNYLIAELDHLNISNSLLYNCVSQCFGPLPT